jgi:hypothetical protein
MPYISLIGTALLELSECRPLLPIEIDQGSCDLAYYATVDKSIGWMLSYPRLNWSKPGAAYHI